MARRSKSNSTFFNIIQFKNSIDPELQPLLELRYQQLGSLKGLILVEPGDSISDLETAMGFPFLL